MAGNTLGITMESLGLVHDPARVTEQVRIAGSKIAAQALHAADIESATDYDYTEEDHAFFDSLGET
jgi:hypothetical protein